MNTHNSGWQLLRSATAVDNPVLGANTMDSKPSYAVGVAAGHIRNIELIAAGIGINNGTFVANIWAGKGSGGPARLIASITFTLSLMMVNKDPQTQQPTTLQRFADTAQITTGWVTDVRVANSGGDKLCSVSFDGLDADWIAAEITNLTNVTKANVYLGYFE